jgi:hypothetical protein
MIFLNLGQYGRLQKVAEERNTTVADLVTALISDLVDAHSDKDIRRVTLDLPRTTYDTFLAFFDDEQGDALASMVGHLEVGADDFARAMKAIGETR